MEKTYSIPMDEPPCKTCRFFRPTATLRTTEPGKDSIPELVATLRICHAHTMLPDFSCYDERGEGREV